MNHRVGEIQKMNNGLDARIIAYRKATDLDVMFENGAVVRGKSYRNFCFGSIKCPMQYDFCGDYVRCFNPNTNFSFLVDADDYEKIKGQYFCGNNKGYPQCADYKLHRLIMGFPNTHIDHINGDVSDNRKQNLRACNDHQNQCNRDKPINNKSGHKGVSWYGRGGYWVAKIRNKGKQLHLGCFESKEDAALAYNNAAKNLFGEFARLNEVVT